MITINIDIMCKQYLYLNNDSRLVAILLIWTGTGLQSKVIKLVVQFPLSDLWPSWSA